MQVFIVKKHYAGLGQIASLILMLIAPTNMANYMGQMAAAMYELSALESFVLQLHFFLSNQDGIIQNMIYNILHNIIINLA